MTRRYRATRFSIAVAGALAIAACSTDDGKLEGNNPTGDLREFSDLLLVSGRNEIIFHNSYLPNRLRTVSHSKRSTFGLVSVVRYL
jgi:hypothetical protein